MFRTPPPPPLSTRRVIHCNLRWELGKWQCRKYRYKDINEIWDGTLSITRASKISYSVLHRRLCCWIYANFGHCDSPSSSRILLRLALGVLSGKVDAGFVFREKARKVCKVANRNKVSGSRAVCTGRANLPDGCCRQVSTDKIPCGTR